MRRDGQRAKSPKRVQVPARDAPLAAVDLGSNSFHLIVGRWQGPRLVVIDRVRDSVQLAAGVMSDGTVGRAAAQRAVRAAARLGERLRDLPPESVRVVATGSLRAAQRVVPLVTRLEHALGHPVEIISGEEEARLIYLGVVGTGATGPGRRLVLDIGGGSTEYVVGDGTTVLRVESLPVGCVTMTRQFFASGRITAAAMAQAELAARLEFRAIAPSLRAIGWEQAIGASGTVKAVAALLQPDLKDPILTRKRVLALRDTVLSHGHVRKLRVLGLKAARAAVFPAGLAILCAAFDAFSITRLAVSEGALREGVLHDLRGRIRHEDRREQTIAVWQRRFDVEQAQAKRVVATVREFYGDLEQAWGLDRERDLERLSWAAALHEVGLAIHHHRHQVHGAYLVREGDLPGFSESDQAWLSALVASHRRRLVPGVFDPLPDARHALRLSVLLRLAVLRHRGRGTPEGPRWRLVGQRNALEVHVGARVLARHPLTAADLEREMVYLREAGFRLRVVT